MKHSMQFALLTGFIFLLAGCSIKGSEENIPEILSVTPLDGSANVAKTISLKVEFSESMDTSSCQSRYGLYPGVLTTFPAGSMMGMGGMQRGEAGHFQWNNDHTEMTFQPDSLLMDSTMYSICLGEGMQTHGNGEGMRTMSGMMGYGNNTEGGIIVHFQTGHD